MATIKNIGTKNNPNWKVYIPLGYIDGKKIGERKQGFKTKKEAEAYVTEVMNKKKKGYIAPTTNKTLFKEFILKWFNEYKINNISINTRTNYLSRINTHIIPGLGSYKLNEITNIVIQDFYNSLINKGLKPSTVKKVMETLNGCFKYAKTNKLIYTIPTDIEKIKAEKPKIEYWSKDEIDFFMDKIKDQYLHLPIFIEVLTGLRIGELCGLRWKDVNLKEGYLKVRNQVIFDKDNKILLLSPILKTSTSNRKISIPKVLINYLQAIKDDINPKDNDLIIKNRYGSICNPRNLSMEFTKNIAKYEDNLHQISFHGLRHTHATLLIKNGENIKVVSERLGHKDITVTLNTYMHIMDDMVKDTADLLDSIFS